MTINDMLEMAAKCVQLAYDAMDADHTADPASVAQAAAQTAQAIILYAASHPSVGASRAIDVSLHN